MILIIITMVVVKSEERVVFFWTMHCNDEQEQCQPPDYDYQDEDDDYHIMDFKLPMIMMTMRTILMILQNHAKTLN